MGHDSQWLVVGAGEPGDVDGVAESASDPMRSGATSAFGEHEVAEASVAWMRKGSLPVAVGDPGVERGERCGVQRHHSFGAELADWDFEPGAVGAEGDGAVEFEIQQFADAHPGGSQQDDPGSGEVVIEVFDGGHQIAVDVAWERAWEGFGQAGQIGEEEQPASGLAGPSPFGDVVKEDAQVDHIVVELGRRHGPSATVVAATWPGSGPGDERFDVDVAVELIEPFDVGVVVGEPVAQDPDRLDAHLRR